VNDDRFNRLEMQKSLKGEPMNPIARTSVILCLATSAFAVETDPGLSELDAKISASLARDIWDEAAKTFVRAIWKDYRDAHQSAVEDKSTHSIAGKLPEVQKYDDYLGTFSMDSDASRKSLEIMSDKAGRFYVKLEGHTIPAVLRNKTVVFTTGDVVDSCVPQLAEKRYCNLEFFVVIRTEGKLFLANPNAPPEKWTVLSKRETK
jgi:hypothetical protein